jgi:hypothetical protein
MRAQPHVRSAIDHFQPLKLPAKEPCLTNREMLDLLLALALMGLRRILLPIPQCPISPSLILQLTVGSQGREARLI